MKKLFPDPSGQINLPIAEALRRLVGFPVKLAKTKSARGGTKSSRSGKPAVANRK